MSEQEKTTTEQTVVNEDSTKKSKPKKSKASAELEALKAELNNKTELLMRTAAEFDNFKKRTEREKLRTAEYAKANVVKTILPALDNAKLALAADPNDPNFAKGIEMIVKQLLNLVEGLGLTELAKVGDTFNPEIHEAVMHIEDETKGENEISAVLQQGYKLGDTVIRPAMVQVAN